MYMVFREELQFTPKINRHTYCTYGTSFSDQTQYLPKSVSRVRIIVKQPQPLSLMVKSTQTFS